MQMLTSLLSMIILEERYDQLSDRNVERLTQRLGINRNPHGLLACMAMRQIYLPVTHMIRDCMHMLLET